MKITKAHTHAVVYVGAPYGDTEGGHLVSLHKSLEAAYAHRDRYAGEVVADLDEPSARHPQTARKYFGA